MVEVGYLYRSRCYIVDHCFDFVEVLVGPLSIVVDWCTSCEKVPQF